MAIKLRVKRLEFEHPGVIVYGDVISPAKPDAGEFRIRIVDQEEIYDLEVGKTYTPVEDTGE